MPENWRIPSYYDQLSTEDLLALQAIEGGDQSIATEDLQALLARIKEAEQQSQPIPSPFYSLRSFADPPPLPPSFVEREDPEPGLYDPRGKDRWAIHDWIRDAPFIGPVVEGLAESAHLAQIGKLEVMPGVPDLERRQQLMQERDVPEEDPTIPGTFGRALGTTLPYIGLGMAAVPIAAGLVFLSVPTAIAATIAGGTAFAAMTLYGMAAASGESAERAIDAGATEEEIQRAAQWGLGVGATEAFPPVRIIRRAARVLGPVAKEVGEELSNTVAARLSRIAGGKLRRVGQAAIEEAIQEAAAEVLQNLIARNIYDPEQGIWTGTGESAGYGGGVGGALAALTEFVLPGMARRRRLSRTQRDREDDAAATEFFNAAQEEREVAASDTDLLGRVVDSMTLTESDLSELNLKLDKATAQNLLNLDLRDPVQLAEARKILSRYRNNPIVQESNPRAVNNIDALLKSDLFAGVWEGDGRRGLPRDVEPSRLYDVDELAGATQEEPITEQPDLIDIAETEQIEEMVDADETQQIEAMLAEDEGIQTAQEIETDRLRQESELESVQRRVEGGQEEQSARRRDAILQPILADEDLTVEDSIEAFSAALDDRGFTDPTPTPSEIDLINRAADVKEALATDETDRAEEAAAGVAPLEALIPERVDVPITPPSEPTEVVVEDEVVTTPETAATEVEAARAEVDKLGREVMVLEERRKRVHPQARVANSRIRRKTELYRQAQRRLWAAERAAAGEPTAAEPTAAELEAATEATRTWEMLKNAGEIWAAEEETARRATREQIAVAGREWPPEVAPEPEPLPVVEEVFELAPDPLPAYINETEENIEKLVDAHDAPITDANKYDAKNAAAFYFKTEEELAGLAHQEFIERGESQIYDEYMDAIERRRIVKERFNLSEGDVVDLAFRSMAFDSAPTTDPALKLTNINRKGNSALEWARNSFPEAAPTLDAYVEEYTAQEEQVAGARIEGEKVERGTLLPNMGSFYSAAESLRGFWRTEVDTRMRTAGKAWSEFFRAAREIKVENTSNGLAQDAVNVQQAAELAETAPEPKYIYHVTLTENVPNIKAEGLQFTDKSNWTSGEKGGFRYTKKGSVFAFEHPMDAVTWARKMEWEMAADPYKQRADISIIRLNMQEGEKIWRPDPSDDPMLAQFGKALRSRSSIKTDQIIDSFKMSEFGPVGVEGLPSLQIQRILSKGEEAPATTQEREETAPEGITVEEKAEAITGPVTTEEEELRADELPVDKQVTIQEQEERKIALHEARLKALENDIAAYVPNRKKASKDTVVEITQPGGRRGAYTVTKTTKGGKVYTNTIDPNLQTVQLGKIRTLLERQGFLPKPEPTYTKETEEYLIADAVAASMPLTSDAVNDLALDGDTVGTYEQLGKDTPNRQVRRTINTLIKGLKGMNTKIVFMDELYDRKGRLAAASYDPNTNTIKLNINLPLSSHSLLHEGAHAITHHIIKNPSHPTAKKLIRLYEDIKDKIPNAYASQSLSDFIVEAFQNPEFQSILAGYKPSGRKRTGWDIFVDALYRLFGIDTGITSTADKAARRYINTLLGTEPNTRNATDVNQAIVNDEYKEATEALMGGGQGFISGKTFKDSARSMWISMRGAGQRRMVDVLGALDLEANVEIAKKYLPSAQRVYDMIYKTDGLRDELMKPFHHILGDSRKAFKGAGDVIVDSDALAIFNKLWNISTVNEVDPTTKDSTPYTKYWLRYGTKSAKSKKINRVQKSFNTAEEMAQEKTILETQRDADRKAGKPFIVGKISVTNPDPQRLQAHRTAQELFKKLNSKQRGVYTRLRDSNVEINDKIVEAEDNNVDQFDIDEDIKASLREIMFQKRLEMGEIDPYFVLYREGEYWLEFEYTGMDGQKHWSTGSFEKDGDRDYAMKKLREMDFVNKRSVQIRDIDEVRLNIDAHAMPFPFLSALLDRVKRLPGTAEEKADLTTFVQDIVLRALPHQSIVQSRRARRNFPFFEQDAIYAYSKRMPQLITAYAGLATRVEMDSAALQLMKESKVARVQHPEDAEFIKEIAIALAGTRQQTKNRFFGIASYVEFNKNPYLSENARLIRAGTFIATLGANVSSIAVNVSIMPLVLQARLSGQYGGAAATEATLRASKLYAQSYGMVERDGIYDVDEEGNRLSDEQLRHFGGWSITNDFSKRPKAQARYALFDPLKERFRQYGFDTRTISQETSDFQNPTSPFMNNFTYWSAFLFNHSERGIRQVSSIAAYTLEMQKLTGKKWKNMTEEDTAKYGEQAAQTATDIMLWVNASPLLTAGSRISQTNLGSVATQFKKVPLRMLYTHMKMADTLYNDAIGTARTEAEMEEARVLRNTFLWLTVSGGTLVGVKGIPFMGMVIAFWNFFRKEDEDDASTIITKVIGQGFAYGAINHIIGVDLTDRINLTNLMIRDRGNYRPRTWDRVAEIAGGPSLGVAMRVVRGMFGRDYGYFRGATTPALKRRALEDAIPFAAVSNFLKALRFKDEGYTTRSGYTIISELSDKDITMQMLGFAPYSTRKARDMRARNNRVLMGINNRKSRLFERLWYAHDEELDEMKEEVLEEIRLFNADHPTHAIDSRAAKRSLRTRSKNEMISLLTGGTLVPEAAMAEMILSNKEFMGL